MATLVYWIRCEFQVYFTYFDRYFESTVVTNKSTYVHGNHVLLS